MKLENFGLFGQQLLNAIRFWKSDFAINLHYLDPITQDKVTSKDLFKSHGDKWIMRAESLPGLIGIKALGVDKANLYAETSQVEDNEVSRIIEENQWDIHFDSVKRIFTSTIDGKTIITLSTLKRHTHRCLWTIPLKVFVENQIDQAISLIDMVTIENCFVSVEDDSSSNQSVATPIEMLLRLDMSIVQMLEVEQVPRLLMNIEGVQRLEQQMAITFLLRLEHKILRMSDDELIAFIMKDTSDAGQKKLISVMHFIISGKIKKAKKELSWKEARSIAWKLIRSTPAVNV